MMVWNPFFFFFFFGGGGGGGEGHIFLGVFKKSEILKNVVSGIWCMDSRHPMQKRKVKSVNGEDPRHKCGHGLGMRF